MAWPAMDESSYMYIDSEKLLSKAISKMKWSTRKEHLIRVKEFINFRLSNRQVLIEKYNVGNAKIRIGEKKSSAFTMHSWQLRHGSERIVDVRESNDQLCEIEEKIRHPSFLVTDGMAAAVLEEIFPMLHCSNCCFYDLGHFKENITFSKYSPT
jgi:hypothetical protein